MSPQCGLNLVIPVVVFTLPFRTRKKFPPPPKKKTDLLTKSHPHRWVIFLSGLAYITLPKDNTTSVYISGGQFGLIFAADTADVSGSGHSTAYPGITETVALQIPTMDGEVPAHTVLRTGPCVAEDVVGLLGLASGSS